MTPRELPDYLRPVPGPETPAETGAPTPEPEPRPARPEPPPAPEPPPRPNRRRPNRLRRPSRPPAARRPRRRPRGRRRARGVPGRDRTRARRRRPRGRAGTSGRGPAPAPRTLERLHHRRDRRSRLRHASSRSRPRSSSRARPARPPSRCCWTQGVIDAERLAQAIAERYGLDYVDLAVYQVDMAAANLISVKSARRHQAVPIGFIDQETLLLAMADPANVLALDDVQMATGLNCRVAVAPGGGHRGAGRQAEHAAEHRRRGDRRGRGGGVRASRPRSPTSAPPPRTRR